MMPRNIVLEAVKIMGPAFLVSVAYLDPGNWATAIEAGSRFGYQLVWVVVLSNLIAILLQTLAARLGLVTGKHLAQVCREAYPPLVCHLLWILCEISIVALDLTMVLGTAIGLNLLFKLPLLPSILLTGMDALLLVLVLPKQGVRKSELVTVGLLAVVVMCFLVDVVLSRPPLGAVVGGLRPTLKRESLYVAVCLLGANVMPHNFYLHSALVSGQAQKRAGQPLGRLCFCNFLDIACALGVALLVNVAVLLVSAATFHANGILVRTLQDAHDLMEQILSSSMAPAAFGMALLCAGQLSTFTGTIAGQVVLQGFMNIRISTWARRLATRTAAIVPAAILQYIYGDEGTYKFLLIAQVVLALQLPFTLVPLIKATSSSRLMGAFKNSWLLSGASWAATLLIFAANLVLLISELLPGSQGKHVVMEEGTFQKVVVDGPLHVWLEGVALMAWSNPLLALCLVVLLIAASVFLGLQLWMIVTPLTFSTPLHLIDSPFKPKGGSFSKLVLMEEEEEEVLPSSSTVNPLCLVYSPLDSCSPRAASQITVSSDAVILLPWAGLPASTDIRLDTVIGMESTGNEREGLLMAKLEKPAGMCGGQVEAIGQHEESKAGPTDEDSAPPPLVPFSHGSYRHRSSEDLERLLPSQILTSWNPLIPKTPQNPAAKKSLDTMANRTKLPGQEQEGWDSSAVRLPEWSLWTSQHITQEPCGPSSPTPMQNGLLTASPDCPSSPATRCGRHPLTRGARKQFTAVLDQFWGQYYDTHGSCVWREAGGRGSSAPGSGRQGAREEWGSCWGRARPPGQFPCHRGSPLVCSHDGPWRLCLICAHHHVGAVQQCLLDLRQVEGASSLVGRPGGALLGSAASRDTWARSWCGEMMGALAAAQGSPVVEGPGPPSYPHTTPPGIQFPMRDPSLSTISGRDGLGVSSRLGLGADAGRLSRPHIRGHGQVHGVSASQWRDMAPGYGPSATEVLSARDAVALPPHHLAQLGPCAFVAFGVWCVHLLWHWCMVEVRPELWGKYAFVLNKLQGLLGDMQMFMEMAVNEGRHPGAAWGTPSLKFGGLANHARGPAPDEVHILCEELQVLMSEVEGCLGAKRGPSGTAAADVAFAKGKEILMSVLKRYKRRLMVMVACSTSKQQ